MSKKNGDAGVGKDDKNRKNKTQKEIKEKMR